MSGSYIVELRNADWSGLEDMGEALTEYFSETDSVWFSVHFPFVYSLGNEPEDGMGGAPVSNPLELHFSLKDMNEGSVVIRKYDLQKMLLDDAVFTGFEDGCDPDSASFDWADRTAQALEGLAAKIRKLADQKRRATNQGAKHVDR